jgi:5'(3')-deoxyribonucleotidase
MKIALDVDGVLADVIKSWLHYNNNRRKTITKNEITEWDFWKKFAIKPDQFDNELPSVGDHGNKFHQQKTNCLALSVN